MTTSPAPLPDTPGAAEDFPAAIEVYRRDLILLCYRFLGSIAEAEEAAQETALRAWRGRAAFRGESSLRTWLHRIATRVCLDLLRSRRRRILPPDFRPAASDAGATPDPPLTEITWLEPIPDALISDASPDPAARYERSESVSLAFIAALQSLSARQRAVLLLRDVLGWSAAETASAMETSVSAANSALHRARTALRATHHRSGSVAVPNRAPRDEVGRRLLEAYVHAWRSDDVAGLLTTMREDVRLAMPPSPTWFDGRPAVAEALTRWVFGALRPVSGYRVAATGANGQPAALFGPATGGAWSGIQVLDLDTDGRVALVTVFLDPAIAARFGSE